MRRSLIRLAQKQLSTSLPKKQPLKRVLSQGTANVVVPVQQKTEHRITLPDVQRAERRNSKFDVAKHIPKGPIVKNNDVRIEKGLGAWVWDQQGKKYLDMTSGIGVLGTGHNHPGVVAAVKEQLGDIIHAQQSMFFSHSAMDRAIKRLLRYTPGGGTTLRPDCAADQSAQRQRSSSSSSDSSPNKRGVPKHDQFLFTCTGSEAMENAVKVAKMHTGRPNVIALNRGFHGRTFGAMAWSSSKTSYKSGFTSTVGGTFFVHDMTSPAAFDMILAHQSAPSETACVLLEPVQGEGGVRQVPREMLQHIRKRCDEHGIILIFDEVQCGAGRCGDQIPSEYLSDDMLREVVRKNEGIHAMWAHQLMGVEPDLLAFAKAIGSGLPVGGVCGPEYLFKSRLSHNALGGTYGGNCLGLAAVDRTLQIFEEEKLLQNGSKMGKLIKKNLAAMPYLEEIRQFGCLVAADLPAEIPVGRVIAKACEDEQLVLHSCGDNALRVIPPYNISSTEVALFAEKLERALVATVAEVEEGRRVGTLQKDDEKKQVNVM